MQAITIHCPHGLRQLKATSTLGWAHVARAGVWKGHESGELQLTTKSFDEMIRNLERMRTKPPIFYDHELGKKAGTVRKLERRGDDLWALFEYNAVGARLVRNGEYDGVSIGLTMEAMDRETGKKIGAELFEVSLTNVPFIDGLTPLTLSRASSGLTGPIVYGSLLANHRNHRKGRARMIKLNARKILEQALEMVSSDSTADEVIEIVKGVAQAVAAAEGEPTTSADGGGEMAGEPELSAYGGEVELQDEPVAEEPPLEAAAVSAFRKLVRESGLTEAEVAASLENNLSSIAEMLRATASGDGTPTSAPEAAASRSTEGVRMAARDSELVTLRQTVEAQGKQLERFERKDVEARVDSLISGAAREGKKLSDGEREVMIKLALADRGMFEDAIRQRVTLARPGQRQAAARKADPSKVTLDQLSAHQQNGVAMLMRATGMQQRAAIKKIVERDNNEVA